ncbi:MAG: signal peptide peptidase SppA [Deltaproteobacteria bacterium]|nr:signal peptide peptidase SppA [Deltaproteobacteria bacterium]
MSMRNIFKPLVFLSILLSIFLAGCVVIGLPRTQPLKEKTIGGSGAAKVLVMDISGIISEDEPGGSILQEKPRITARVKEELDKAAEDSAIKALILRINTPGGSVTSCDIISHEIKAFKKNKNIPVVAELMDTAASGGYYIASSGDMIIAHPTTVTGSIGVISYSVNASGLLEKIGIADQTIKSGDKKDIGTMLRPMTEEERAILQSVIDSMYDRFLDVVVEGRRGLIPKDELRKIADGRVLTAGQALSLKLIDSIGYMDDAIEAAKKLSGVKEARIITYAPPSAYRNNIYSGVPQMPSQLNLINIDPGLSRKFGTSFMYIWMP